MKPSKIESTQYKIYVDVVAEFTANGKLIPRSLTWEDGRKYEIDRVICCQRAASRKAGGTGLRYTIRVQGQERFLFYEENYHWFVESKLCRSDEPI